MNMKEKIRRYTRTNANEDDRQLWLAKTLAAIPTGLRILDAGAGELRNKPLCAHLKYISQDICEYDGNGDKQGLHTGMWDTSRIDLVCDILEIPEPESSFDVILCSEVFEHLPDALKAMDEFFRLLKPAGKLIITAPFSSLVHFAPFHYATGFSKYWYEYHLPLRNFEIKELTPNGDWFSYVRQEIFRLPGMARKFGDRWWPLAYFLAGVAVIYFSLRDKSKRSDDTACFGWHCVAQKKGGVRCFSPS